MNPNIIAMCSIFSMLLLWLGAFWLHRDYRTEVLRQKIFALRNEFFDLASDGKITFDSKAYGTLRTTMNGMIRFAHQLTFPQFLLIVLRSKRKPSEYNRFRSSFAEALAELSNEEREICERYLKSLNRLVMTHIALSSPLFLVPIVGYSTLRGVVKKITEVLGDPIIRVDNFAYALGEE